MYDLNRDRTFIKHLLNKYIDEHAYALGSLEIEQCLRILEEFNIDDMCEFLGITREDYDLCPEEWDILYYEQKFAE